MALLSSCSPNKKESVEIQALNLLHDLPNCTLGNFYSYYPTNEEFKELATSLESPLDNWLKKKWVSNIENDRWDLYIHGQHVKLREDLKDSKVIDSKKLTMLKFEEKLDDGVWEREQYLTDGKKIYRVDIDYVRFQSKIYLIRVNHFFCEENCHS